MGNLVIFITLLLLYCAYIVKLNQWCVLDLLSLRLNTPQYFMTHKHVYLGFGYIWFLSLFVLSFHTSVQWYWCALASAPVILFSRKYGMKRAFDVYRETYAWMAEKEPNVIQAKVYHNAANASDEQLREALHEAINFEKFKRA